MRYTRIILLIIAPLLLASTAMSQTDWEAVQALPNGTKIKVTLKNRPTFGHCFLDGVSDDQLVCSTGRWPLSRRNVYMRDDIKAVYLVHNGPAIGLAVGAGDVAARRFSQLGSWADWGRLLAWWQTRSFMAKPSIAAPTL